MRDIDRVLGKLGNLSATIDAALEDDVAKAAKKHLARAAKERVYDAYQPKVLFSRWGKNKGVLDTRDGPEAVMHVEVRNNELTVQDSPRWQQLYGGRIPDGKLLDAIVSGNGRYNMQLAGPRPFHEAAEEAAVSSGDVGKALRRGMKKRGIQMDEN